MMSWHCTRFRWSAHTISPSAIVIGIAKRPIAAPVHSRSIKRPRSINERSADNDRPGHDDRRIRCDHHRPGSRNRVTAIHGPPVSESAGVHTHRHAGPGVAERKALSTSRSRISTANTATANPHAIAKDFQFLVMTDAPLSILPNESLPRGSVNQFHNDVIAGEVRMVRTDPCLGWSPRTFAWRFRYNTPGCNPVGIIPTRRFYSLYRLPGRRQRLRIASFKLKRRPGEILDRGGPRGGVGRQQWKRDA